MDQKHSMMYPSLNGREEASSSSQQNGIPTEAPPSYDMAMSSPEASAPVPSSSSIGLQRPPQRPPPPVVSASLESYSSNVSPRQIIQHPVIVEQPSELEPIKLGPRPSKITCPECGERRRTRMHFTPNRRTHIFAVVLCLVGWCCCACTVPYCMRSCKTGHHYCSKCNRFLGTYNRNDF